MTAVVGILNRRGTAIAADSAVTRHRGFKGEKIIEIYNEMGVGTDGVNAHCFFLRH